MIPRIIHQTWKTAEIPAPWQRFQQSWRTLHPTYEYHYRTDADNRAFVDRHYPDYLTLYDGYPLPIQRADFVRYLLLRHYGGVYVDMDFEALRPLDTLLEGASIAFGLEPDRHVGDAVAVERGLSRIVCNAFMASEPGHPFWDHLLPLLVTAKDRTNVLDSTGPFVLTRACDSFAGDIAYVPSRLLYPVDNAEVRELSAETMRARAGDAYAIHHWSGSWWRDQVLYEARTRIAKARLKGKDGRSAAQ